MNVPPVRVRAVDGFFGEDLEIVAVVRFFIANDSDSASPAVPNPDDLETLAQCAVRHRANRGIQTRDIAAAGENSDGSFFRVDVCHMHYLLGVCLPDPNAFREIICR